MSIEEKRFWNLIKSHLPGDVSRIENIVDEGTPDVSGAWSNRDYWVELKICHNKKKLADPTSLCRGSQLIWHLRRARHGSIIFLAVYYDVMGKIILYKYKLGDFTKGEYGLYIPVSVITKKKGFNWEIFEYDIQLKIIEGTQ